MATLDQRTSSHRLSIWIAGILLSACSGSGGAPGAGTSGFSLATVGVLDGQIWQINRPIKFTFTESIDFDTVNMNTIHIQELSGAPAIGEFFPDLTDLDPVDGLPRAVYFQPKCPTEDDFGDAGLLPGNVHYQIDVLSIRGGGATTVRSKRGGRSVSEGRTLVFRTPSSLVLSDLFMDAALGPPAPLFSDGFHEGCRVEVIDPDTGELASKPFIPDELGFGNLESGYLVPNNLYSDPETWVSIVLEFNQAVNPTAENINASRLRLEYETVEGSGQWTPAPTVLDLEANCTETGSTVRMSPIGILPQDRPMRVSMSSRFEDLVGNRNAMPLDRFARMHTDAARDEFGNPVETADEILEPYRYDLNAFEDTTAALDTPRALWGNAEEKTDGLRAAFAFDGTGGPGGQFDLWISSGSEVIFDTTSTMFFGGPNGTPQYSQLAVNGQLDVRDLRIEEGATLRIQGPNPAVIKATGNVTVLGTLSINGSNAVPVFTMDTPSQPESGAVGQGGGGDGGTGSYLTTQVTPRGGNGFGAFQRLNLGGEGGESGWHSSNGHSGGFRRGGGGGGGALGHDVLVYGLDGTTPCPDEKAIGLNAEDGFVGHDNGNSSQGPHKPYGGHIGPRPFSEVTGTRDDFYGTKREAFDTPDEVPVTGELTSPWPGSGGGAGGDATWTDVYPPTVFIAKRQDKGAGGGGGAGALTLLVLGDILVSGSGSITAIGGHGGGGENTAFLNRIGGGSGGGSGGHIILEAGGKIDFSEVADETIALNARGGEGGAGADNEGGATLAGDATPSDDAKHCGDPTPASLNSTNVDNPWIPTLPETCIDLNAGLPGGAQRYIVRGGGGDGGPGLIQLHVGNLSGDPSTHDIRYPGDDPTEMGSICYPPPHGYDSLERKWVDHLLPTFGRFSQTQSIWMPLGAATVAPGTIDPDPLTFLFDGIDPATGLLLVTDETVDSLAPLLAPTDPIEAGGLPDLIAPNTVRFAAGELAAGDVIYKRNPNLLRRFRLTVDSSSYRVASAKYVEEGDFLDVTTSESSLENARGQVTLVPRYLAVSTDGVPDYLPETAQIKFQFQATTETEQGKPDPTGVFPSPTTWSTDIDQLTDAPNNTDFRFLRYRVIFDIARVGELDASSRRPVLEFLRMPFRF